MANPSPPPRLPYSQPVDGVSGPFAKFKRRLPGIPCLPQMDKNNSCSATYAHLNGTNSVPFAPPASYAQTFVPYPTTAPFRLTLIVREGQARVTFVEPLSGVKMMLRAEPPINTYRRVPATQYGLQPIYICISIYPSIYLYVSIQI